MKGQIKIKLNGKDVELKFTLGAIEDFQDYCEEQGIDADMAETKMKHLRHLLHYMSGGKVEADAFRDLELSEISKFKDLISQASAEVGNVGKGKK